MVLILILKDTSLNFQRKVPYDSSNSQNPVRNVYKLGMVKMSKIINNAIKESDIIKRNDSKYLMGVRDAWNVVFNSINSTIDDINSDKFQGEEI